MALYFLCPISDQLISPFLSRRLIQRIRAPRSHVLVHTEINFLCHSFDRSTIEESFSNVANPKSRQIEKFGKTNQGKRKQVQKSD